MSEVFRMVNRIGNTVLRVFRETDTGDGHVRYGYSGVGCGGHNVNAARILEVVQETRDSSKSARVV